MAVAGGVQWTVLVKLSVMGDIIVVRREQAQGAACDNGTNDDILNKLLDGATVRLTERRLTEFRKWEETA